MKQVIFGAIAFIAAVVGITLLGGSWYTIGADERGVVFRNGRMIGTAEPGLGWKTPWIESVETYSIAWNPMTWEKLQAYSKDQQPADMKVSISWQLLPDAVSCIPVSYRTLQNIEIGLVAPKVQNSVKNIFGTYTAQDAINKGSELTNKVAAEVEKAVNAVQPCGKPFVQVQNFSLENIDFSDAYEKSVEARMVAEIEVSKARQNADRAKAEADQAFNEADGRARSMEREAEAKAKKIRLEGDAAAAVIEARGKALRDNPGVAALAIAERWDGKLPVSMVPGATVPLMNITAPSISPPPATK